MTTHPLPTKKWYQKTGGIVLSLFLFFPFGLYLMWKYAGWHKVVKIILTNFLLIGFFFHFFGNESTRTPEKPKEINAVQVLDSEEKTQQELVDKTEVNSETATVAATTSGVTNHTTEESNIPAIQRIVTRVIDGDSLELESGEKVRLIGINTPESTNKKEVYGLEASNYTKSILTGKTIWMTSDQSDTDSYGRLLRLIWLEKPNALTEEEFRLKCFNAHLLLNGYAEVSTYPPDTTYSELFKKFDREANSKGIGLWKHDNEGTTKGDFDSKATKSKNTSVTRSSTANNENTEMPKPRQNQIVYFTPNGKSYHMNEVCRTLSRSKIILNGTVDEAITSGHDDPCDVCN